VQLIDVHHDAENTATVHRLCAALPANLPTIAAVHQHQTTLHYNFRQELTATGAAHATNADKRRAGDVVDSECGAIGKMSRKCAHLRLVG